MRTICTNHDVHGNALASTIGPLLDDPVSVPLSRSNRALLMRWRDQRWAEFEQRVRAPAQPRDAGTWYEELVFERWRSPTADAVLSPSVLDLFYKIKRFVPRFVQLYLRRRLVAKQGDPIFPAWPFEVAGVNLVRIALADALLDRGVDAVRFPWFWPDGATAAVALSHDIESADGLSRAPLVASWEELYGFRSAFNIVSDWYPIDMRQVHRLSSKGHEIGSHGIYHDRSLFASRECFERQLPLLREFSARFGAVGFRSPSTHRVVEWLEELPFSYDCTMPHSDPYEPIPGGTATVWPFFHGEVVELPYTAPQDHTLFNLLGHRDCTLWRRQFDALASCNGLFQVITHPDSGYLGRPAAGNAYRALLRTIAERTDTWVALPRDIAAWWRRRATGATPRGDGIARWTGTGIELSAESS
jgi:peptidoglycan/xylan/chitin deacetylase (PgdA/CDA1 family)